MAQDKFIDEYVKKLPKFVDVREVGPREGFQRGNIISTELKIRTMNKLIEAGITKMEVGTFGSRTKMPHWSDVEDVIKGLNLKSGLWGVLLFTEGTLERAISFKEREGSAINEVATIIGATEPVLRNNGIPRTLEERVPEVDRMTRRAHEAGMKMRIAVSAAFGCSIEGWVHPQTTMDFVSAAIDMGADDVHIGDSTGQGNPVTVLHLFEKIRKTYPKQALSAHFHNNRGLAVANILVLLENGLADNTTFDSSFAEIGGCPFIGASGNVSTEDMISMFHGMGIETGIDIEKVIEAGKLIQESNYGESLVSHTLHYGTPTWWQKVQPKDYFKVVGELK